MRDTLRARIRLTIALALSASLVLPAVPAHAVVRNAQIDAKRAEAARAQTVLDDMHADFEEKVEEYNAIDEALAETRGLIRRSERELAAAEARLKESRGELSGRVSGMYRSGDTGILEVVLGTRSFEDFLTRLDWARRIADHDAQVVKQVESDRAKVEDLKQRLEARATEQAALRTRAEAKRREVKAALGRQQGYLRSINGQIAALVKAEQERQRRIAEEAARKARAAAAARAKAIADAKAAAARRAASGRSTGDVSYTPRGDSDVVDIALSYLGVPYVWGGTTPSGFDCSGLVQYCYRKVGVSLPRTSRSQFRTGTHISRDRLDLLQPGDLVFFGTNGDAGRIHHVGMYVGDGQFVHAPQTGDVVKVSSLRDRISRRGDYVGATRY